VLRNRARRRLRAALGAVLAENPPLDLVVSAAASDVATARFAELMADVERAVGAVVGKLA